MNWTAYVVLLCVSTIADSAVQVRSALDVVLAGNAVDDPVRAFIQSLWLVTSIWTLTRPSSIRRYVALCFVGSVAIVSMMPLVPNHFVLELALFSGSLLVFASIRNPTQRYAALQVSIVGSLFVVYGWAVLHKLNTGFVDPSTSCGAVFLEALYERLNLAAPGPALRSMSVFTVLLAELSIPALLAWRRTRAVGVVAGMGMHFMFGLFIPGFSVLVWGIYFLLLPPMSGGQVWRRARAPSAGPRALLDGAMATLILIGALLIKDAPSLRRLDPMGTLFMPLAILIGVVLVSALRRSGESSATVPLNVRALAVAVAVPVLLSTNGLAPYLGIRNTLAFSMFSNLRTESGVTNHLFLPVFTNRLSTLADEIEILESSDPILQRYAEPQRHQLWNWSTIITPGITANFELPFFMMRYRAQQIRDSDLPMFSVRFRRGADVYTLTPEEVRALPPVGWMARRVFHSKGTPLPPHENACMW